MARRLTSIDGDQFAALAAIQERTGVSVEHQIARAIKDWLDYRDGDLIEEYAGIVEQALKPDASISDLRLALVAALNVDFAVTR